MEPTLVHATMVRLVHSVSQEGAAELREFGLTPAQYQLLVYVSRKPGIPQWRIVESFGVTKGNVSQLVKKLEASGLLQRTRSEGADQLALSPAGQDLVNLMVPAHDAFMERRYGALSTEELSILQRLLSRLSGR